MPDLTDEMRQLAADGAAYAHPLAITDVMKRGNRRRARTITQRSIGGLSAVGLGAAVLFTGATHHLGGNPAAASSAVTGNTITTTSTTSAGDITMRVKYKYLPKRKIRIESVVVTADTRKLVKNPSAVFIFGPGLSPSAKATYTFIGVGTQPNSGHHFTGSLPISILGRLGLHGAIAGNGSLRVSLGTGLISKPKAQHQNDGKAGGAKSTIKAKTVNPGLTAVVILTR